MPTLDWLALSPHLVVSGFAVIVLLIAAARGDTSKSSPVAGWVAAIGCAIAAVLCVLFGGRHGPWDPMFVWDPYSAFFAGLLAVAGMLVCLSSASAKIPAEFFALLLLSTVGLMFMASAGSLLMLYLSLELSTICLFVLAGFYRWRRRSSEAALKYLITAGTASSVFLFGVSWIYGAVGSTDFQTMRTVFEGGVPAYAWLGIVFVLVALAFKVSAVPFHLWAPDVYEGAPTPITAFLSTASKGAGFVVLVRLVLTALPNVQQAWLPVIVVLAVATMVVGNLVAIVQSNVKRLLAYSGIAQAGFILIAVAAASKAGVVAMGLYLLMYVFANVGAFLCVYAVCEETEEHGLDAYDGLSRRSPMLAFAMLIFLLSLAGIPPLAGFVGKFMLFKAGMDSGLWGLVLIGAVASTVSLYYYLIVAKRMYISAPGDGVAKLAIPKPLSIGIGLCVVMTGVIGLYPGPWLALCERLAQYTP